MMDSIPTFFYTNFDCINNCLPKWIDLTEAMFVYEMCQSHPHTTKLQVETKKIVRTVFKKN